MGYGCGDNFSSDYELDGIPFQFFNSKFKMEFHFNSKFKMHVFT